MESHMNTEEGLSESLQPNEIRVTSQGRMHRYIAYAIGLFEEQKASTITIKATGKAIVKAVSVSEIVKRRISGLHQITNIGSAEFSDTYSTNAGVESHTKLVSSITITLTRTADSEALGYQLPSEDTKPVLQKLFPEQATSAQQQPSQDEGEDEPSPRRSFPRGRGRGRGRGGSFPPRNAPTAPVPFHPGNPIVARGGYRGRGGFMVFGAPHAPEYGYGRRGGRGAPRGGYLGAPRGGFTGDSYGSAPRGGHRGTRGAYRGPPGRGRGGYRGRGNTA